MGRSATVSWIALTFAAAGVACSKGGPTDSGVFVFDAGFPEDAQIALGDATAEDQGSQEDATSPDAAMEDVGLDLGVDLGAPDLGLWPDAEPLDLGPPDNGVFPDAMTPMDAEVFDIGPPDLGVDAGTVTLPDAAAADANAPHDAGPPPPDAGPVSCEGYGFNFCSACLGVGCCADLWSCDADAFGCRSEYLGCFGNCMLQGFSGQYCTGCFESAAGRALAACMFSRCSNDCN